MIETRFSDLMACVWENVAAVRSGEFVGTRDLFLPIVARLLGIAFLGQAPGDYVEDLQLFIDTSTSATLARHVPLTYLESEAYRDARRHVMEFADSIIASRSAPVTSHSADLVDDLLESARANSETWSASDLRADILGPFVAGLDQVTNTCSFISYALFSNEEVLRRVQMEVDSAFTSCGFQYKSLDGMRFLQGVVLETLRLYPTAPVLQGTVIHPFEFAGYEIEAGESLIVATSVSHFLSDIFPEPFQFDPDRTLILKSAQECGSFGAFGVGHHHCIASAAAKSLIMITISVLLNIARFKLFPNDYVLMFGATPAPAPHELYLQRL